MDAFVDPITGRHFPNRILFLIDLTPLTLLRSCGRGSLCYLDCVLSAAKLFLSSSQFSSSLFAFKPFFSSLSPLLSSSKLPPPFSSLTVHSTIYWISQKYDPELASENPSLSVATELMDLLLSGPKELAEKSKRDTSNPEQDASSSAVREFKLQILFRMEILRSRVAGTMNDSQQRFVKQICILLECIQCQLEGGFFGDWSLDDYAENIIKRRYSEVLEDVVNQICSRMDLLLFNDEDEADLSGTREGKKMSPDTWDTTDLILQKRNSAKMKTTCID